MKKFIKSESGQALVETAIILPVILIILMGIIETGMLFTNKLMLDNIVREGVRSAVSYVESGDNISRVRDRIVSLAPDYAKDNLVISIQYSDTNNFRMGDVTATATYTFPSFTPFAGVINGGEHTIKSSCTMKVS